MLNIRNIFQKLEEAWGLHGFTLEEMLEAYCLDQPDLPKLTDQLKVILPSEKGLFCLDTAGLATHVLGLYLIKEWREGKCLTAYQQILWLPYAKLNSLPIKSDSASPLTLNKLATLLGSDTTYEDGKSTLVIITGIDYRNIEKMQSPEFSSLSKDWLSLIKPIPWLAIGNFIRLNLKMPTL